MTAKILCSDEQGTIWEVPSQSSDEFYVCAINENDELFCSCPDWLHRHFKSNGKCKHLKEVIL